MRQPSQQQPDPYDQHADGQAFVATSVLLPIEWQTDQRAQETKIAVEALMEAALSLSAPVSLAFALSASAGDGIQGGLVVSALDPASTLQSAHLIKAAANSLNNWQALGDPRPWEEPEPGSSTFDLAIAQGPGRQIFNYKSAPWELARKQDQPTTLLVELRGLDTDCNQPAVRCTISVTGEGPALEMNATLLAADIPGEIRLEAVPREHTADQQPELALPLSMAAHLISSPARIPQAWPAHPVHQPGQIMEMIDQATPPHAALFGGSGQGKTTFMEHLVDASLGAGNTVVVVCPHGDLASRAATLAQQHGARFGAVDFADYQHPPRWNLCEPPPGVTPTQWAAELIPIVRTAWTDMPEEYFGPVWAKSMRVALSVLTRDPQGPHPLSDLAGLMLPPIEPKWVQALQRIDDSLLTREVEDLHRAATHDSEARWGIWTTAKIEAFTAHDRVRQVIGHRTSSLDLTRVVDGESLIVSAPASALGDEGASLLAGTLITQLWHLIRRQDNPEHNVDIYLDEAHRIPPHTLNELLAEGRKFGIRLRLATQSPHQLDPATCNAMLNNTGTVGTFRVGPREARYLDPMFPTTRPETLNRLNRHWLAITNGEQEHLGPAPPPIVDPDDQTALTNAHRNQHPLQPPQRPPHHPPSPTSAPNNTKRTPIGFYAYSTEDLEGT